MAKGKKNQAKMPETLFIWGGSNGYFLAQEKATKLLLAIEAFQTALTRNDPEERIIGEYRLVKTTRRVLVGKEVGNVRGA